MALTGVAAALLPTTALIVDHGLQAGSAAIASAAQRQAEELGCVDAQVLCVQVGADGGPEGAARTARYRALQTARRDRPVLLAHTLDDQAETVLLRLIRGTGIDGLSGIQLTAAEEPKGDSDDDDGKQTGSYESRTVTELRELAKDRGIEGYSKMNKKALIVELRG